MRNVLAYYFIILFPFTWLIIAARLDLINSNWFAALLLLYFLFRQFTDAWRLVAIGVIDKVTWKTVANPFLQAQYCKELYWFKR